MQRITKQRHWRYLLLTLVLVMALAACGGDDDDDDGEDAPTATPTAEPMPTVESLDSDSEDSDMEDSDMEDSEDAATDEADSYDMDSDTESGDSEAADTEDSDTEDGDMEDDADMGEADSMSTGDADAGATVFTEIGCSGCHAVDSDEAMTGPTLMNIASVAGERVDDMSAEEYLHESVVAPDDYIVEGYEAGVMPNYSDQLDDEQVNNLVAYLMTLSG